MLKKFVKWLSLTVVTFVVGITLAVYLYKDQIIDQVLAEINKGLNFEVLVEQVDIDFLYGFPNIAVNLQKVNIPDKQGTALLDAGNVYVILNPVNLLRKDYTIERLEFVEATVSIKYDERNEGNFEHLFKAQDNSKGDSINNFSLNTIVLSNVELDYINQASGIKAKLNLSEITGRFQLVDDNYISEVKGDLAIQNIDLNNWQSDASLDLDVNLSIRVNKQINSLIIENSILKYAGANFDIAGSYQYSGSKLIDLNVNGDNLTLALVSGWLPANYQRIIQKYKSTGNISFKSQLQGKFSKDNMPSLNASLEFIDVNLRDQKYHSDINNLNAIADIKIPSMTNFKSGKINVSSAQGILQDEPFSFDLEIKDFENPIYKLNLNARVATGWLLSAMEYPFVESAKGSIDIDLGYSGKFENEKVFAREGTKGKFELNNVSFGWSDTLMIDRINGSLLFEQNTIEIQNIGLNWLGSNVIVNGNIEGWGADNQNIVIRSNVRSGKLSIEHILTLIDSYSFKPTSGSTNKQDIEIILSCQLDDLRFRRFRGKNIAGDLFWQDNVLEVENLNGKAIGGNILINGLIKEVASNKDYYIEAEAKAKEVFVDSLFYVFENFQQDWIVDKHLKGQVFSEFNTSMYFDSTWRFRSKLLKAEGKLKAVKGELNDFEPLMELSRYIDDKKDSLSRLRFSDLDNYITIRNDTVYIPEMSIHTNIRNIALGGYHTLDQHIYYQLAVPVINERIDKDEVFGAVKKSSKGAPNLLFIIEGTTDDYSVKYDLKRATDKVLKLLDITKIFRKDKEESLDTTFLEDEEFDWKN